MNKWLKVVLVLIVLALLGVLFWVLRPKTAPAPTGENNGNSSKVGSYSSTATVKEVHPEYLVVEMPVMTTGTDGLSVFSTQTKKVLLGFNTKFNFDQKPATRPANYSDIKVNSQIIITSSENFNSKSEFTANSISASQ